MKKYRVKLIRKYNFDLDGISKNSIREQVDYILTRPELLEKDYVIRKNKIIIKETKRKKIK
jgi:hypothetical protein